MPRCLREGRSSILRGSAILECSVVVTRLAVNQVSQVQALSFQPYPSVAQLVEQSPVKGKVAGSSPAVRAIFTYFCRLIGRTTVFGAVYLGSSPSESAKIVL